MGEIASCDIFQRCEDGVIDPLIEELQVCLAVVQHIRDDILQKFFGKLSVSVQIAECHFRFDHPEFGKMARRIGVLSPESRPESIYIGEGERKNLRFQLPGNGQVRLLPEEVLLVVNLSFRGSGKIHHV